MYICVVRMLKTICFESSDAYIEKVENIQIKYYPIKLSRHVCAGQYKIADTTQYIRPIAQPPPTHI